MKIRFLTTIPTATGRFCFGQVIDVEHPTPDMLAWLQPCADGTVRAEVVRDEIDEQLEVATVRMGRRGRPRKYAEA
jgi:hypothetical protein